MKKVFVLCTGNSCRSQMMHGFLNDMTDNSIEIYSAGIETHGINPFAQKYLNEIEGIDISSHTSNLIEEYDDVTFDYIITVCDNAKERCPIFPSSAKQFHHNFTDPSKVKGNEDDIKLAFAKTIAEIKSYSKSFVKENL